MSIERLPESYLTIMAFCVRSCDYLMAEMKRGNIEDRDE